MILYFPVTALVTLFGNILQNPLDPRAKSDTRLMNLVVTFLSTLGEEVETGGIRRMLSVCSEFEHIARVVIEKAEKDSHSKRKRKSHEPPKSLGLGSAASTASQVLGGTTPTPTYDNSMGSQLSPKFHGEQNRQSNSGGASQQNSPMPTLTTATTTPESTTHSHGHQHGHDQGDSQGGWPQDFSMGPDGMDFGGSSFAEFTGFGQPAQTPPNMAGAPGGAPGGRGGPVYQPMLPQDVWQLPMTLDYDWAETLGAAYPGFENGSTMQS